MSQKWIALFLDFDILSHSQIVEPTEKTHNLQQLQGKIK